MSIEASTIKVLSKNSVKCLVCNTTLESKHQHDFQQCNCSNKAFVDGGLSYNRIGAMDLDLIEILSEHKEVRNANTKRNT